MPEVYQHKTVLLEEAVAGLNLQNGKTYIDGTFGRGGHSRHILSKLNNESRLIAIDRDPEAIQEALKITDSRFSIVHDAFSNLEEIAQTEQVNGKVAGIILDLGVSSPQLEDPSRGFSFMRDGPLDMRMNPSKGIPASTWLAQATEEEISWVLKTFGEERFAKRIATAIVARNRQKQLTRTGELAELITKTVPVRDKHKHAATRSFQAIRIFINSELQEIELALVAALDVLEKGGRLSIISFHSLEDRIVKQFIKRHSQRPAVPKGLPLSESELNNLWVADLKKLGKSKPSENEIKDNPRARSAVLRIAEKV